MMLTFTNHDTWYKVKLLMPEKATDFFEEKRMMKLYKKFMKIVMIIQF